LNVSGGLGYLPRRYTSCATAPPWPITRQVIRETLSGCHVVALSSLPTSPCRAITWVGLHVDDCGLRCSEHRRHAMSVVHPAPLARRGYSKEADRGCNRYRTLATGSHPLRGESYALLLANLEARAQFCIPTSYHTKQGCQDPMPDQITRRGSHCYAASRSLHPPPLASSAASISRVTRLAAPHRLSSRCESPSPGMSGSR